LETSNEMLTYYDVLKIQEHEEVINVPSFEKINQHIYANKLDNLEKMVNS